MRSGFSSDRPDQKNRPFGTGSNYRQAFALLSIHAKARMSPNQFLPAEDDKRFEENESRAVTEVAEEVFLKFMEQVEDKYGIPDSIRNLHVHSTDPQALSGQGELLDSMFAIGGMPKSIPTDIRRASLRGQITTKLTPEQLKKAAEDYRTTPEELSKDPDFLPYFTLKAILLEEEGALHVGYFEFLPPSMLD